MYYGQCEKCEWLTSSLIWNNHCLFIHLKWYNLATLKRLVNCCLTNLLYYCSHFNPFGPKSDQHLFSPYNISRSSRVKVMRITKFIIKGTGILNQILSLFLKEMYGDQSGEFVCGSWRHSPPVARTFLTSPVDNTLFSRIQSASWPEPIPDTHIQTNGTADKRPFWNDTSLKWSTYF